MYPVFVDILNNSLSAVFLIFAVIAVRLVIKKAPKWIPCLLWGLVALKLILPFDIESALSLVPSSMPIPADIVYSETPHIESGIPAVNGIINPVMESSLAPQSVESSVNPMQAVISVCALLWLVGIAVMLIYLAVSYLLLKRSVAAGEKLSENVYICDEISAPFLLGFVRPRIYLPSGLTSETRGCVLEHERAHMKRLDYLWKPLGYIILAIHWFNPLCWVSYTLFCRDIEFACDEKVTGKKDKEWKARYCEALLDCGKQRKMIAVCPVAFGEVSIKDRVKSVLNYKKPAFRIMLSALAISAAVAVCFITDPKPENLKASDTRTSAHEENRADSTDVETERPSENEPLDETEVSLTSIIRKTIIDQLSDETHTGDKDTYHAANFIMTDNTTDTLTKATMNPAGEDGTVGFLGMAMYMEAEIDEDGIHEISGIHSPLDISFTIEKNGYQIKDFLLDYKADRFPENLADAMMSDERYSYANRMNCYSQIIQESDMQTFPVIGRYLDLICVEEQNPATSDYIDGTVTEINGEQDFPYRELIYYGEYTLAYRDKFGGGFSGLRKEILNKACDEIEKLITHGFYHQIQNPSGELLYLETHPVLLTPEEESCAKGHTINGEVEILPFNEWN